MIYLTTLDGRTLVINAEEIETIDKGYESLITLKGGRKIIVRESAEDIVAKVISYKKEISGSRSEPPIIKNV